MELLTSTALETVRDLLRPAIIVTVSQFRTRPAVAYFCLQ